MRELLSHMANQAEADTKHTPKAARMLSIDVLRGFDMFWIVGGGAIVNALSRLGGIPLIDDLRSQLSHVEWDGFRFYDLIFPLFVFIAGVSAVFSLTKARETGGQARAARRLLLRGLLLFAVGVFYSGGISQGLDGVRWLGVLQRIALSYTGAGILYLYVPWKYLLGVVAAILLGYWLFVTQSQVRNIQLETTALKTLAEKKRQPDATPEALFAATTARIKGPVLPGLNVVNHFDFQFLPGRKHDKYYDPEGYLSTFPAIATCLLGVFAGLILAHPQMAIGGKTAWLFLIGCLCLIAGLGWSYYFPIIKKIWSSSFVLVAGGFSFVLLAVFHHVIDVLRWRAWATPFVWVGTNALTIYIVNSLGLWRTVSERVFGGPVADYFGRGGLALVTAGSLGCMFLFARFLYQRGIFFRL